MLTYWLKPARNSGLFTGIHVDIEPYSTPAWSTDQPTVVSKYLTLLDKLKANAGTSPIEASSGEHRRHRLSWAGNRQLNRALHLVAVCQIRTGTQGKDYYQQKLAETKTSAEARRALKRRLSDAVYRRITKDQQGSRADT